MSTGNIISIVPTRAGCTVTFRSHTGPRAYAYPHPGAEAIMAGEDPKYYPCEEVNPLTANSDAIGEIIDGAGTLLEDVAEIVAEAAL
jgi:hypothetical protein